MLSCSECKTSILTVHLRTSRCIFQPCPVMQYFTDDVHLICSWTVITFPQSPGSKLVSFMNGSVWQWLGQRCVAAHHRICAGGRGMRTVYPRSLKPTLKWLRLPLLWYKSQRRGRRKRLCLIWRSPALCMCWEIPGWRGFFLFNNMKGKRTLSHN